MTWEGSADRQKKALQMFTSSKIVNVKGLVNEQVAHVNAMIKKVFRVHETPQSYYAFFQKWNTNQSSL